MAALSVERAMDGKVRRDRPRDSASASKATCEARWLAATPPEIEDGVPTPKCLAAAEKVWRTRITGDRGLERRRGGRGSGGHIERAAAAWRKIRVGRPGRQCRGSRRMRQGCAFWIVAEDGGLDAGEGEVKALLGGGVGPRLDGVELEGDGVGVRRRGRGHRLQGPPG